MANKPYRLMYRFWLDITKSEEEKIADQIETLKNERSFSQTIRDGIRLIVDLRKGKLDVLFELFPFVKAEFLEYMKDIKPNNGDSRAGELERKIERLEQLILAQRNNTETQIMKPMSNGLKQIGGMTAIAAPQYDDDDDLLTVTKANGDGSATQNFLRSMLALQH